MGTDTVLVDRPRFFVTGAAELRAGAVGHYQLGLAGRLDAPQSVEVSAAAGAGAAPALLEALASAAAEASPAIQVRPAGTGDGVAVTFAPGAPPVLPFRLAAPPDAAALRLSIAAPRTGEGAVEPAAAEVATRIRPSIPRARWRLDGALDGAGGAGGRYTISHDGPGAAPGETIGVTLRIELARGAADRLAAAEAALAEDLAGAVSALGPGAGVSAAGLALEFAAGAPASLALVPGRLLAALGAGETPFTLRLAAPRGAAAISPEHAAVAAVAGAVAAGPRWRLSRERAGRGGRATYLVDYSGPPVGRGGAASVRLKPVPATPAADAALAADLDRATQGRRGVRREGLRLVFDHGALPMLLLLLPALEALARAEGRPLALELAEPAPGALAPGAAAVSVEPALAPVIVDGDLVEPVSVAGALDPAFRSGGGDAWAEDGAYVHSRDGDPRLAAALRDDGGGLVVRLDYAGLLDLAGGAEVLRLGGDKGDRLEADLSGHAVRVEDHGGFTRYIVDGGAARLDVDNDIEQAVRAHFTA